MPTHALLGATGSTGSSILRYLLSNPPKDLTLNILLRNKPKLLSAFPDLESKPPFKINIIEGTPSSLPALTSTLRSASTIYMCMGSNYSKPGTTLMQDTASSIIAALKDLNASNKPSSDAEERSVPTIVQLRAMAANPVLSGNSAGIIQFCLKYCFDDHKRATELYTSQPSSLLRVIYIDAPAILDPDGTERTGHKLTFTKEEVGREQISYADLGAVFVEVGERKEEFENGVGVGCEATGKVNETWGILMRYMAAGARGRLLGF